MKKIIKLFVATAELYQSPLIATLSTSCDAALTIGEEQLLQVALPDCRPDAFLELSYNPDMLEVTDVRVEARKGAAGCLLAVRTRGCELGHTFLTIFSVSKALRHNFDTPHFRVPLPVTAL
jgi:hypothetical protein